MAKMTPERARTLLTNMSLSPGDVAEVLRHVLAQAAEQGAEAAPAQALTKSIYRDRIDTSEKGEANNG